MTKQQHEPHMSEEEFWELVADLRTNFKWTVNRNGLIVGTPKRRGIERTVCPLTGVASIKINRWFGVTQTRLAIERLGLDTEFGDRISHACGTNPLYADLRQKLLKILRIRERR